MSKPHLISFDLCPFVQRAVIALNEKEVPYDITYIDLRNKPEWFLKLSPLGKVPVMQTPQGVLFESQVIAEYLDETVGERLHPEDPFARAQHRAWIEVASTLGGDAYRLQSAKTEERATTAAKSAHDRLALFEAQLAGPLFAGDKLCLVDAAAAPMLQRLTWAENRVNQHIFDGLPKVTAWRDALLAHPSVKASLKPDIADRWAAYLDAMGSWLSTQAA